MTDADRAAALTQVLKEWWNPPADLVATIPKGGVALQYVGHADVTRALIEIDPLWSWEPMGFTDAGQPVLVMNDAGQPVGMWGWLTVCGVRRPGYGSCLPGKNEAVKELVGDFIRNAALRFGFCGALWSKADRSEGHEKQSKAAHKKPEGKDTNDAGKANYEGLVKMYGEEEVKGALATLGISRWHELVGDTIDRVDDLLHAKKLLADDMGATQE
jgi:hypothetical protein